MAVSAATLAIPAAVPAPANDPRPESARETLRFITCGSVDDGKSTLIGRLLHDTQGLYDDQVEGLRRDSLRFGTNGEEIDFALLLDGLEAEREQGITIDVAHLFFGTPRRAFVVADTPGHVQYTRNMATGASTAELAVLLVDARKGLLDQTRRHAAIVSLLGIRHVVLAVNKIDLVDFSAARFAELVSAFEAFAAPLGFLSTVAIPVSARYGDNVTQSSARTPWYTGPTLLTHLETIEARPTGADAPFRFPVQWVNRPDLDFRGLAGTVASGSVAVGDTVVVAGSGRAARVKRIVTFSGDLETAGTGRSVTLTLSEDLDIARGDVLVDPRTRPMLGRRFAADLVWMSETPADTGPHYLLKCGTLTVPATLTSLIDTLDVTTLARRPAPSLELNGIGRVHLETLAPIAVDPYGENPVTGAFILIDRATNLTVAAGMITQGLDRARNVYRHPTDVTPELRAALKGQNPLVIWLTGLPGSGKSTIANLVERRLAALGHHTMLLDGDNLRQGLNADLGFDTASRRENVRRVGEVAKLLTDAGVIVIAALVSPFRADRARVAALLPEGSFLEVFVDAPLELCRARDPKGLYAGAEAGRVTILTGRDHPYEAPEAPALTLPTAAMSAEAAADKVLDLVLARVRPVLSSLDGSQL